MGDGLNRPVIKFIDTQMDLWPEAHTVLWSSQRVRWIWFYDAREVLTITSVLQSNILYTSDS